MTEPGALPVAPLGEPLVDARTVAAYLGVHVSSVYRLAGAANGLPVVEIARGVRRFRPEDVRAFVERRIAVPVMAPEARKLLDSIAPPSIEVPRLMGHIERPSRVQRGASSRRADGGA